MNPAQPGMPGMPGMDPNMMKMFSGNAPPRTPPTYDQTNLEGLFRFLVTVPLGFILCYMGISIADAFKIWAPSYLVIVFLLKLFKMATQSPILHEFSSFFSHLLAFGISYVLMYNINLLFSAQ